MICTGQYQYPGQAAREAASLSLTENSSLLTLTLHNSHHVFTLEQITVSDALGTIPLTVTFADGARFVPEDDLLFRKWYSTQRKPTLIHRLEQRKRHMVLALVVTFLLGSFYIFSLLPWLSTQLAYHIPVATQQKLGDYTLSTLIKSGSLTPSTLPPKRQQALQDLFQQVIPADMQNDNPPLRLKVMRLMPDGANAFMLADGSLILTDKLVKMANSDDAIAAVMLHEIGHHRYRHSMRGVVRSSLVTLSVMWMTGDVSGIGDTVLESAVFVDQMQFSRSMEREADHFAILQMRQQNRPLSAMIQIFQDLGGEKADSESEIMDWLSTHPAMKERLQDIAAAAAAQDKSR